jgi:hypothetical protein
MRDIRVTIPAKVGIGGTTNHDSKAAGLAAVTQERPRADSFADRCSHLASGSNVPKVGWVQLTRKTSSYPKETVLDDRVKDMLFGGLGSD